MRAFTAGVGENFIPSITLRCFSRRVDAEDISHSGTRGMDRAMVYFLSDIRQIAADCNSVDNVCLLNTQASEREYLDVYACLK